MEKRVLFVGANGFSVIMNALRDTLTKNNYVVDFVKMNVDEICKVKQKPNMVLIYTGDEKENNSEAVVYLKDFCIEHEVKVALVGHPDEIVAVKSDLSDSIVWEVFERPFDANALVKVLDLEIERQQIELQKKHILVVDDSEIQLRLIKSWLSEKYIISTANSATQAISFLMKETVDLILLDYEMPVCSGPQFLEMIHSEASTSSIPVIFLTAMGDINSVKSVLALKPAGYLLKTMAPDEIKKNIDDFFEKRKAKQV